MIRSFKSKETKQLFYGQRARGIPNSIQRSALRKLLMLNGAVQLHELRSPPSNHLEALRGNREGQHSIRINDQWRICFEWVEGNAHSVEIIDYH